MVSEKKRILVVDDDADSLRFAERVLAHEGFDVLTAASGEEAVRRALSERPELIILDVFMPEQNGWETCDKLRDTEEMRRVPIVFLTCLEAPKTLYTDHGAFATDWDEYLEKPITAKQLLTAVKKLLDRTSAAR
jgi:CheY-like chemotaxis protein